WPGVGALLWIASSGAIAFAGRALRSGVQRRLRAAFMLAAPLVLAAILTELYAQLETGLRPAASSYAAAVFVLLAWQAFHVGVLVVRSGYPRARSWCGLLGPERRVTFDNVMLFWHYTVGQGVVMLALIHAFPRLLGP